MLTRLKSTEFIGKKMDISGFKTKKSLKSLNQNLKVLISNSQISCTYETSNEKMLGAP